MEDNVNQNSLQTSSGKNSLFWGLAAIVIVAVLAGGYLVARNRSGNSDVELNIQADNLTSAVSPTNGVNEIAPENMENINDDGTAVPTDETIEIEGGSFYFKPNIINAKVGQTVKIKLNSVGGMPHDFVIDELGVDTKEVANDSVEFEFTPEETGNFEFYCSVGSHRKMGMKGTLIVE